MEKTRKDDPLAFWQIEAQHRQRFDSIWMQFKEAMLVIHAFITLLPPARDLCESPGSCLLEPFPGEGRGPVGKAFQLFTTVPQLGPGLRRGTNETFAEVSPARDTIESA